MDRVFVDTDIIIDLFAEREPFYRFSAGLFTLIDSGTVKGHVSPVTVTNLHYILSRLLDRVRAYKSLQKLTALVTVLPVDEKTIDLALSSDFRDFEDAVQYYTALQNRMKCLITRNVNDYRLADIPVMTAEEYLSIFKS